MMSRTFNITADCKPSLHYMVDLSGRLEQIKKMVDAGQYFTINRARQYGKTTTLRALAKYLIRDYVVYMDRLNKEYIELLSGEGNASDKFWALEERINKDKKDKGVILRKSRSQMLSNILSLIEEGAIGYEDLDFEKA